jgi:class 3 adenylate cyclase
MDEELVGGRYALIREIARSGAGVVWEAEDRVLLRRVAVKRAHGGPDGPRGSESDAVIVARFSHPHVARVYDGGVDDGRAYTVMELLDGEDLERRFERLGRMSLSSLNPWLGHVAMALDGAHTSGVAHGDVRPSKLFMAKGDGGETLRVLDFGTAVVSMRAGRSVAAPDDSSAEAAADRRDDLVALAAVAWRALTGQRLFDAATAAELRDALARGERAPDVTSVAPDVPPVADQFFARAFHADPTARFQTAREFADAVRLLGAAAETTRATRVLVVDDEPDVAVLIRQSFRRQIRAGVYEFLFALNGVEALRTLQANPDVDVVLSDINMPEMDGLTFLASARAINPLRRVVMVSAYGDLNNIRTAMNRGAFDFVTKPVDMADLEATIRKAVAELAVLREAIRRWAEAERARANLARYFPPSLVEMLASDAPTRTAKRADVGVLFADIVGFTQFAESIPPEAVLALLREFHAQMEAEVFEHGGTLEKYIGDALLVTFGVPNATGRDAVHALACARAMLAALENLNRARVARGDVAIRMGVGLHWGPAVLGHIGSDRNMSFAVIGDTVNTASRLQAATRDLDASLLVSQDLLDAMRAEVGDAFTSLLPGMEDLGEQLLRGRARPLRLWKLPAVE